MTTLNHPSIVRPDSERLILAPSKSRRVKTSRLKKRFFKEGPTEALTSEIIDFIATVPKVVSDAGAVFEFCQFCV